MGRFKPILLAAVVLGALGVYAVVLRRSSPPPSPPPTAALTEPSDRFLQKARGSGGEAKKPPQPALPPRSVPPPVRYSDVVTPPPPPPPRPAPDPAPDPREDEVKLLHKRTELSVVRRQPQPAKTVEPGTNSSQPDPQRRIAARTLLEGTRIRALLVEPVRTDQPVGHIIAVVLEPVHDGRSGRHLLIPVGTRAFGTVQASRLQSRAAQIHWHRLLTPEGRSIDLSEAARSTDADGGYLDGRRRSHSLGKGLAVLVTALTSAGVEAARPEGTVTIDSAAAAEGAGGAEELVAEWAGRQLNRPPTIRLRAGTVLDIRVQADLVL